MKKAYVFLTVVFSMVIALPAVGSADSQAGQNFIVHLSGAQAAPPVDTRAQGQASFQLSNDGDELRYKLMVSNITNVMMAHIHLGAAGVNGPVVAWLYPTAPPLVLIPGKFSGVLAEGTIIAASLVGPLTGQHLSALLEKMKTGETYVNVHTNQYPAGEIRGQIRRPGAGALGPVIPRPRAFTGGDYWVTHLNASRGLLINPDGTVRDPSTYTEDDWALARRNTRSYLGWGFKFQFSPPDASGNGTVTIVQNGTEHRHQVDQTTCTDCGIVPFTTPTAIVYTITRDNQLTITDTVRGDAWRGAFSRDFNTIIAAAMEGNDAGKDMLMGVKAATTAQTMTDLYAGASYEVNFNYPYDSGIPGFSSIADMLALGADLAWFDLSTTSPAGIEFESGASISNPALVTAFANASTSNYVDMDPLPGAVDIGADGTHTSTADDGAWMALSPDGEVAVVASGINDIDPRYSDAARQSHHEGLGMLLKQAPLGTHNRARLAGRYILINRWDNVYITIPSPITDCYTGAGSVAGSVSCGAGIRQSNGMSYIDFTLRASGDVSYSVTNVTDLGEMTSETGTATFTVETQCYGVVSGVRLSYGDPVCTGGRMFDVMIVRDTTSGGEMARFFIAAGGDVLTFFDPKSIDPAAAGVVGLSRSMGYAVRIN